MLGRAGWTRVAFGDVVQLVRERSSDPEGDGFERYVGLEHIDPGDLRIRSWGNVADGTTFTNVFRAGQVLFGKRRAYQRKLAVAHFDGICSGDIYVFEPKDDRLLPELLPFICQTDSFFEHAVGTSAGSLSPRTNWDSLARFQFALPRLEEQERLVSVLTSAVLLEEQLDALHSATRSLRTAAALDALGTETRLPDTGLKTRIRSRPWRLARVESLALDGQQPVQVGPFGGSLASRHFSPAGVEVLKVHNVGHDGLVDRSRFVHVSGDYAKELARYVVRTNDLLIVAQGDTTGRVAIVRDEDAGALISQHLIRVRLDPEKVDPRWMWCFLRSPLFIEQASRVMAKSTRPGLNTADILAMQLPLPPREDQQELAARVFSINELMNRAARRRREAALVKTVVMTELLGGRAR